MVKHKCRVIKNEIVTGGEYHPYLTEIWTTFNLNGVVLEAYMGLPRFDPEIGKEYIVDLRLMTYSFHHINIEEKMLKQISTFPMDPLYIVIGELVEVGELKVEEYRGEETKTRKIKIDCGIEIESKVWGWIAEELKVEDYIAIIGKMFGEIVRE